MQARKRLMQSSQTRSTDAFAEQKCEERHIFAWAAAAVMMRLEDYLRLICVTPTANSRFEWNDTRSDI